MMTMSNTFQSAGIALVVDPVLDIQSDLPRLFPLATTPLETTLNTCLFKLNNPRNTVEDHHN